MRKTVILLTGVLFLISSCTNSERAKTETEKKEHEKFSHKHTIEELKEKFSEEIIAEAKKDVLELEEFNKNGKFKGTLESIDTHKTPEWYRDAKLCIFYDWGLYSIAGFGIKEWNRARYPDWYLGHMYNRNKVYHLETWGNDFERDDFIPLFTAKNFNAREIVEMVKMSGAKYIVPFNKHHDGYCLWDSKYTQRDVVDMMPGRDLTAELVEECKKAGIYYGFYFSVEDYEYPLIDENNELYVRYWSNSTIPNDSEPTKLNDEITTEFIPEIHNRMISGKIPVYNFIDEYIVPQAKDFIDKYDPDILWFDGEWSRLSTYYRTPEIVAYFYNKNEGKKEVVSNDRLGSETRELYGDFHTSETDVMIEKQDYPWEENRSMAESYGYYQYDSLASYLTPNQLIEMFVRIVAKGGNLNLIVNPDGSGKVDKIQMNLLKELGEWLEVNGEAIYGTRPYEKLCDNTQLGQPVWYTMSKDSTYGYAIAFEWPRSETFILRNANVNWDDEVYMLGYNKPLKWVDTGSKLWGMSAEVPKEMLYDKSKRPCKHAWVIKFKYDKNHEYGK